MNTKLQPGSPAPDFNLPSTAGPAIQLSAMLPNQPATVLLFLCNHCPHVKAYIPRLIALQKQFTTKAQFIAICSNDAQTYPDDSFENMKRYASQWGLNFPYLHDDDQAVAAAYGAERTPEVFVLDSLGLCRYEGGIDDNEHNPNAVTQRPLHDAILALTTGKPVTQTTSFAIGCTIKWKK